MLLSRAACVRYGTEVFFIHEPDLKANVSRSIGFIIQ